MTESHLEAFNLWQPDPAPVAGPNRPSYHGLIESGGSGDGLCACTHSPHGERCPRGSTSVAEFLERLWWQKKDMVDVFCMFIDSRHVSSTNAFSHVIICLVWHKFVIWSFQPFEFDRRFKYEIYIFKMFKQSTLTTHLDKSWYVSILESFSKIFSQTLTNVSLKNSAYKKLIRLTVLIMYTFHLNWPVKTLVFFGFRFPNHLWVAICGQKSLPLPWGSHPSRLGGLGVKTNPPGQ